MATTQVSHGTAWSSRLSFELNGNDQTAQALVSGLSEEQLNWQPAPGAWSIEQCLEHPSILNEKYLLAMAAALDGKPDELVEEIRPGWLSAWFLKHFVEPSPSGKKVSAPKGNSAGATSGRWSHRTISRE